MVHPIASRSRAATRAADHATIDTPGADEVRKILAHVDCDEMLLYSSDFPHWHFDGMDAVPPGMPDTLVRKMMVDNPLATYPRLKETLS